MDNIHSHSPGLLKAINGDSVGGWHNPRINAYRLTVPLIEKALADWGLIRDYGDWYFCAMDEYCFNSCVDTVSGSRRSDCGSADSTRQVVCAVFVYQMMLKRAAWLIPTERPGLFLADRCATPQLMRHSVEELHWQMSAFASKQYWIDPRGKGCSPTSTIWRCWLPRCL